MLGSVVRRGVTLAGLGSVLGVVGALALGPVLEGLVFGVTTTDWGALALGPLVMAAVVILASTVPALRASRADPLESLRAEVRLRDRWARCARCAWSGIVIAEL